MLWCSAANSQDAVRAKLDEARVAYDTAVEKYRADACDWFDKREQIAREKGDKKQVDRIKDERQAFDEKDELPDATPLAMKRLLTKAQADMEAAYKAAVAGYTRAKKDDEAAAVEKEWTSFKQNEIGNRFDRL